LKGAAAIKETGNSGQKLYLLPLYLSGKRNSSPDVFFTGGRENKPRRYRGSKRVYKKTQAKEKRQR